MTAMYEHDFHALCEKGHKRNFIWHTPEKDKLESVVCNCVYCGRDTVKFTVKKYWKEPKPVEES